MGYFYPGPYIIYPQDTIFFITFTVIDWVDVFTRDEYKRIVADSLEYCRKEKGLLLFAWVLMTNHIHLIVAHETNNDHLWRVIGDFKKFTSRRIIRAIADSPVESRKKWMLRHFLEENILESSDASCSVSKNRSDKGNGVCGSSREHYHLWQRGYSKYCIHNIRHMRQKLDYIHENPIRAGMVSKPWEYRYSSAPNYCGEQGVIDVDFIDLGLDNPLKPRKW